MPRIKSSKKKKSNSGIYFWMYGIQYLGIILNASASKGILKESYSHAFSGVS